MKPDRIPVSKEGVPFIGTLAFFALLFALIGWNGFSLLSAFSSAFTLYFFRDPVRVSPSGEGIVCAPADGRVIKVYNCLKGPVVDRERKCISIFMNVFNCHVNRAPVSGVVREVSYKRGSFWPAYSDKALIKNEHSVLVMEDDKGRLIETVQVAGILARRIVCRAEPGDRLRIGERFGLIRFGSRLDVYLPPECSLEVSKGDRVYSGETIIARF